jgi:hypothetical protein
MYTKKIDVMKKKSRFLKKTKNNEKKHNFFFPYEICDSAQNI